LQLEDSQSCDRVTCLGPDHFVNVPLEKDKEKHSLRGALFNKLHIYDVMDTEFVKLEELERLDKVLN